MKNSGYTYNYLIEAFEDAKATASSLIFDSDKQTLKQKSDEASWSMIEILNHLVQAGNEYLSQINTALDKNEDKLSKGTEPFSPSFMFRWFIKQVSPENTRKLPTVPSFEPKELSELDIDQTLSDFIKLQDSYIHILKRAKLEGLDLDHIHARNPILKFVPMSLTACFGVTEAHQRRHFEQMRKLRSNFVDVTS